MRGRLVWRCAPRRAGGGGPAALGGGGAARARLMRSLFCPLTACLQRSLQPTLPCEWAALLDSSPPPNRVQHARLAAAAPHELGGNDRTAAAAAAAMRHSSSSLLLQAGRSRCCATSAASRRSQPARLRKLQAAAAAAASAGSGGAPRKRQPPPQPPPQQQQELVVGIDLGTTNSAVAHIVAGKPACIPNRLGDTLTPSVVAFQPGGATLVGRAAKGQPAGSTYYSVKRLIGRAWDDPVVQEEQQRLAYTVACDSEGAVVLECPHVEPGCLYPEEVSACVLHALLEDARAHTGCADISKAVITVPAYFDDEQREATIAAGKLAGLQVVRLVREPVAAALAYGLDLQEEQVVLVFDLGGGTFDVSLLEVGNGTIEVLSTGGDAHLGGDDWDAAIVGWLRATFLDPAGVDSSSPAIAAKLKALAEFAKVALSDSESVLLRMPLGGPGGGPLAVNLDRSTFDELSVDLFRRARLPLDQACWTAGVDLNELQMSYAEKRQQMAAKNVPAWKQEMLKLEIRPKARAAVSKVLLVGGATRMPAVQRFISNMTGLQPEAAAVDPDEAVALGAAVQAGILQGEVEGLMVIEQWQASLMRALAQLQLAEDPSARAAVEASFDLGGGKEAPEQLDGQGPDGGSEQQRQEAAGQPDEGSTGSKPSSSSSSSSSNSSSSRSLRLRQRQQQQQQQLKRKGKRRRM